jgi:hypothetical protein
MTETAPYEKTGQINGVELRKYAALKVASVAGLTENEAFWILFRYISGNNRTQKKIAMTAPVISSETIEMTTPVITQKEDMSEPTMMSFIMPSRYNNEDVPEPKDQRIRIHLIPSREVAVLRFSGHVRPKSVQKELHELQEILRKNNIQIRGAPFLMQYNSPMVPGILRRNEVGIEILRKNG